MEEELAGSSLTTMRKQQLKRDLGAKRAERSRLRNAATTTATMG